MINIFYIYKLFNNDSLLYIGKSKKIHSRINSHKNSKIWFNDVTHIHLAKCNNEVDMDIYERYYINKLNPIYNIASVKNASPTFKIDELRFKILTLTEFLKAFTPKPIRQDLLSKLKYNFNASLKYSVDITNSNLTILDINSCKFHWYIDDITIRLIEIRNYKFLKYAIKYIIDNNIALDNDFEIPLSNNEALSSDNFFTGVCFSHYNTITYRNVISSGSQSFTECVTSQDKIPISCSFINIYLKHLFENKLLIKHIVNWKH